MAGYTIQPETRAPRVGGRLKVVTGILSVCCVTPSWYYLLWWLLKHSGAGDLQWFLFWLYAPLAFFVAILKAILDRGEI